MAIIKEEEVNLSDEYLEDSNYPIHIESSTDDSSQEIKCFKAWPHRKRTSATGRRRSNLPLKKKRQAATATNGLCLESSDMPTRKYHLGKEFSEKLIEKVQPFVFLYDPTHPLYRNLVRKAQAWRCISEELGQSSDLVKQKWRNLRDSYIKYKRSKDKSAEESVKKYKKWQWGPQMEFLDYTLTSRATSSNLSDSELFELSSPSQEAENLSCLVSPSSFQMLPAKSDDEDNKINQLDAIDYLFLSYSETFKRFTLRRQAKLKMELANLFARAEMKEMDAETSPS